MYLFKELTSFLKYVCALYTALFVHPYEVFWPNSGKYDLAKHSCIQPNLLLFSRGTHFDTREQGLPFFILSKSIAI